MLLTDPVPIAGQEALPASPPVIAGAHTPQMQERVENLFHSIAAILDATTQREMCNMLMELSAGSMQGRARVTGEKAQVCIYSTTLPASDNSHTVARRRRALGIRSGAARSQAHPDHADL